MSFPQDDQNLSQGGMWAFQTAHMKEQLTVTISAGHGFPRSWILPFRRSDYFTVPFHWGQTPGALPKPTPGLCHSKTTSLLAAKKPVVSAKHACEIFPRYEDSQRERGGRQPAFGSPVRKTHATAVTWTRLCLLAPDASYMITQTREAAPGSCHPQGRPGLSFQLPGPSFRLEHCEPLWAFREWSRWERTWSPSVTALLPSLLLHPQSFKQFLKIHNMKSVSPSIARDDAWDTRSGK